MDTLNTIKDINGNLVSRDGVPVIPMTPGQIQRLNDQVEMVRTLDLPQLHDASDPNSRVFVMTLDGTSNNRDKDAHSQEDTHLLLGLPDGTDSWYHGDNQNRIGQDFIQRSLDNQAVVTQAEAVTIQVRLERDPEAWFESANSEWKNFEAAA